MTATRARLRIGDFLVEKGVLNPDQVERILEHSTRTGLRFGEAGIDCGLLTEDALKGLFGPLYWVDYFHLQPELLPESTRDWIEPKLLLQWGILPLGFKQEGHWLKAKKILNVGMLNPTEENIRSLEGLLATLLRHHGVDGVRPFLILADPFLDVIEHVYGISESHLKESAHSSQINETLALFLE